MKKFIIAPLFIILIVFSGFHNLVFAKDSPIKIVVNGVEIEADQPPLIINGRALVPLRAIFEALNSTVDYEEGSRKVTASRGDKKLFLYLGLSQAVVNNKQLTLDVPAQVVNGRALVPVRFVSEALGDQVFYDSTKRQVSILRKQIPVGNVVATDIADYGDGRDLEVSFKKADNETRINEYRILVVKTSKAENFDIKAATNVPAGHYTVISKTGKDIRQVLTSTTRDTDGALLESDISYTIFVLQSGLLPRIDNFLAKSTPITLTLKNRVPAIANLEVKDVTDYGDGRDIEVSFTKIPDETGTLYYRAIVVPVEEVSQFNLSAAKEATSSNYTTIYKTGSNIVQNLYSSYDYKGRLIQIGVPYRVYILSVGNASMGYGSSLSLPSAQLTLAGNPNDIRAINITAKDISDYGNGLDLEVSFKIPIQESRVNEYRVMVVPATEVNSFTIAKANKVTSPNYSVVYKTGLDHTVTFPSNVRDVNGNLIRPNLNYRVLVLSIGGPSNGFSNSLSSPSQAILLTDNFRASSITTLRVYDISDHGDGRDMQVTFNKVTDESVISEYRIIIVKSAQASGFTLAQANNLSSDNYTTVSKTGFNLKKQLSENKKDAFGALIREGVEYRVFVLSVSSGGNKNNNSLSGASSPITLRTNASPQAVISVSALDVGNAADGSDLEVRFTRIANEAAISEYRILVVKSGQEFSLAAANLVSSNNYFVVPKTGQNIVQRLNSTAKDVQGDLIKPDIPYKVYVLSVSNSVSTSALSNPSAEIILSNPAARNVSNIAVIDIANNGNGEDMQVSFSKPTDESNIAYYMVMIVREVDASTFDLTTANLVPKGYLTRVNKTGNDLTLTLSANTVDIKGNTIRNDITYRIFVLSVADGVNATINGLASSSETITLRNN